MSFRRYRRNPKREISVTFMSGPNDGKKLAFAQPAAGEERMLSIGRREGSDIHLPFDSQVSRLHARLGCSVVMPESTDGGEDAENSTPVISFWLEDGGSRNGTFVEKQDDAIEGQVSLRPGTLFRIGRTWLRLDVPLSYD